jgi:PAS domain S-box-containing protein
LSTKSLESMATAAREPALPRPGLSKLDWRPVGAAALTAAAYYLGAKLGLALTFHPHPISVLWPPNALLLAALLITPVRWWWGLLAAAFPAHLLAEVQEGVPTAMVLCWFVSNASEALIGAATVRWVVKRVPTFDTLGDVAVFIVGAACLAPFLSSFLDAGFVVLNAWGESGYWDVWRTRFIANSLATLTLVPVIATWSQIGPASLRSLGAGRLVEAAVLALGLVASGIFVFEFRHVGTYALPPLLYLVLPFLLWAAFRFGTAGASAALLAVALMAIWGAAHGRGPFTSGLPLVNALAVQLFLVFVTVLVLSLAAAMTERRRADQALRQSEERYREMVEIQTELVCRYRPDTTLTYVNEAYCRFFGRQREELIGRSLTELVPESAHGFIREYIAQLARVRRPSTVEHQVVAADGSLRWQQWVDHAIVGADGTVVEFQGIGRDITDRKAAEELLRQSDERFQLVLRSTNAVIYDWDMVSDNLWWSPNGLKLFGYEPRDRLDNGWWVDLLHPEDREPVTSRFQSATDGDALWEAEYRLRRADGSYAWVHERGYILRQADRRPLRMIGTLMDITDHKRVEEINEELVHASRLAVLGELSASIAHEINQPLGAILSNADSAEMLLESNPPQLEELKQVIDDIRKDDIRAGEVIRRMRSLLRKQDLVMEPFDLNRAISDLLELVRTDVSRRGAEVTTRLTMLPIVHGDQVHVQQVVMNLVLNALEAMAESATHRRRIEIATGRSDDGQVQVTVADTGPGIRPEHLALLFDSFFTTKQNGMGLGLSIARSIVEAHGGRIWAENGAVGGASFHFSIPAKAAGRARNAVRMT